MTQVNAAYPVRSVALTCDFFRAEPKSEGFVNFQTRNLAWLEQMVGAKSTWARWGVKTSVVTAPIDAKAFKRALGNSATYANYLSDADQAWASLYNIEDVEDVTVFPAAFAALLQHDLVVGFELPPTLKRVLHRAGKRYISFYIHPIRFLRDLCLLVTTNSNEVAALVAQGAVPEDEVDFQVRRFSALFARQQLPALSLPDGSPVLVGQTEKDSVLIRGGHFTNWQNYESEISELLGPHPEVIFLEHPYRANSALVTEYLRGRHGKTVISLRANSYGVMFSPLQTPFVLTLASSLGVEARYAGRDSTFLYCDPRTKFVLSGVDVPGALMVSHAVLQGEFWQAVFSGDFNKSKPSGGAATNAFPLGDNYIRNSLDAWAFRPLQSASGIEPVRKLMLPATTAPQHRLDTLHAKLCASVPGAAPPPTINGQTQLPWGAVSTLPKPFVIGPRSALNLAQAAASHYLVDGFHPPEGWGVWSRGQYAKLVLPVDMAGAAELELNITMVVKAFDGLMAQAPVMQITMDGREVGMVLFRASAKNEQEISFTGRIKTAPCHIEFYVSNTASPAVLGQSPDQRELGFGLCALNVAVSMASEPAHSENRAESFGKFWGISANEVAGEMITTQQIGGAE